MLPTKHPGGGALLNYDLGPFLYQILPKNETHFYIITTKF